ncbi:LOW QUALITY PROTEIN: uncharacterized protein LOC142554311 [Primulina tabacum]|uniref:LOW QUALITY PROTEIN: uncharacterized protein LOC142554311 n=1 Tax=Primulina tabacum TaxID=48773 RepID=UPI003F59BC27
MGPAQKEIRDNAKNKLTKYYTFLIFIPPPPPKPQNLKNPNPRHRNRYAIAAELPISSSTMTGTEFAFSTTYSLSSSSSSSSSPFSLGFLNPSSIPTSTTSPISLGFGSGTASSTPASAATSFGGSSIFGSSPSPVSNLFGSSTGAGLTTNMFGSSSASGSTPTSNLFGSGTTPSTFGSSASAITSNSFGSSLSGCAPTTNILGSGTAQSMFGSSTAASVSSPFGSSLSGPASSSNLFGSVSALNILGSSSLAPAFITYGSPSSGTGHTASMFGSSSATAAGSPSPSSSPFGISILFASPAPGSLNLSGFGKAPSSGPLGFSSGASNSSTTTPAFGSSLASSSNLFGSSLSASNAANTASLSESGRIPGSSVFGSSTAASTTSASTLPVFDDKSPAGGLFAPCTPSFSTTVASMGNTPSFGLSSGSTLGLSGSSSSMFGSSPATLFCSLSSSSLGTSPLLTTNASSLVSAAPGFSFATASGSLGNAPSFGSNSASTLSLTGSSSIFSSSPAPLFGSLCSSSTTTSFPAPTNFSSSSSSAPGFSFANSSGSPGFHFPQHQLLAWELLLPCLLLHFQQCLPLSSGFSFLKNNTSLASGAASSSSSSLSSALASKASVAGTTPSVTSASVLSSATAFSTDSPASSGFTGFSADSAPVLSSGATSAFSLSLKSPIAASSASSQSQSVSALPSFDARIMKAVMKAEMLKLKKKKAEAPSENVAPEPSPVKPPKKKSSKKKEGPGSGSYSSLITAGSELDAKGKGKGSKPMVPESAEHPRSPGISFLTKPNGPGALGILKNLVSSVDLQILQSAPDSLVEESMALSFMQTIAWAGEHILRSQKTQACAQANSEILEDVLAHHDELTKQLRDIKSEHNEKLQSLHQSVQDRLKESELETLLLKEEAQEQEVEAEGTWARKKEEFLQSPEFVGICAGKAVAYFEEGFKGCLAQFRANGYSEADHPASFLDSDKALEDMPEECEVSDQGDQADDEEAADPQTPFIYLFTRSKCPGIVQLPLLLLKQHFPLLYLSVVALTISTTSTALASAPKLPSEISGRSVEEIIKEWNAELQERAGKFQKQANAIAEWDCRILQNRDILLTLESEVAKVVGTQGSLERGLELIETYQDEVDKALQSMEEEAERIYREEHGFLLDDEAASTRDAMYEQAEMTEGELEHTTEQIKSIIDTINANKGGELEAKDGMTSLDIVVRILNNQMSSSMWVDEKVEEFYPRIQKLANQGSATDHELIWPELWLN